jgi:hypothetical protein
MLLSKIRKLMSSQKTDRTAAQKEFEEKAKALG